MAILDSIAIEIQATIAGALILLIITLLELLDLRRARKEHRQELQTIASTKVSPLKKRLISPFSLVLQFIFGFSAFALFVLWMMYLIIRGMPVLAGVAGVSAFIAVLMPFIVWSFNRKANQETAESIKNAKQHRQESVREQMITEIQFTQTDPASTQATVKETVSFVDDPVVNEPVQAAKPQPITKPQPVAEVEVKPALSLYPQPDPAHVFPQDSMLRRHFIGHLSAVAKPYEPGRPVDSMLRRHHDAMLANPMSVSPPKQVVTTPAPATAQPSRKCTHQVRLPEDSMLKRHFLTTLQLKFESCLSLPGRPTDSMLRRHFDAMKENLVAAELNRYRQG
jgi:hypothetical protein